MLLFVTQKHIILAYNLQFTTLDVYFPIDLTSLGNCSSWVSTVLKGSGSGGLVGRKAIGPENNT